MNHYEKLTDPKEELWEPQLVGGTGRGLAVGIRRRKALGASSQAMASKVSSDRWHQADLNWRILSQVLLQNCLVCWEGNSHKPSIRSTL